jgi:L-aminopeptidase/D-esterase-like protein
MRTGRVFIGFCVALAGVCEQGRAQVPGAPGANDTLTAVPGIKVGHHTLTEHPTGCTVVLTEAGGTAGVDARGAAPATRETDLLEPVNLVQQIHAISLSGGSAFGLDAASGVMRYLEERKIGFRFGAAHVPIVPAAAIFDLGVGNPLVRPGADCGYNAARSATSNPVAEGSVGAGAGATVGKAAGLGRAMKAGVGTVALRTPDGVVVAALVVVNAYGDVLDQATGRVVAGTRREDGRTLADARTLLRAGRLQFGSAQNNSTLAVIATNVALTKTQATRVAQLGHDGLARAISPIHTPVDGDVVFAVATGVRSGAADVGVIGGLAAEAVADAIVRAATQATGLPNVPAVRDLR